ncbi:MAG: insulinase family protein [Chloroflexota bacterium]
MQEAFELIKEQPVTELNTQAKLYRHRKTGAELLSMENNDENKVFGVTFATPPQDATGLPHILEHSVLCGSRNYPLKKPFVELIKGSLKTFLNAFTFPDKTCYPVASQNLQDFYNLVNVYLDAVFYPRISPEILQQEGWHYELDNIADPLIFKGVVFNEMKGAYSSPDRIVYKYSQQTVFPDNVYGVDSGGDPKVIPDLTYEQFKTFHETYYHPTNARFYFYGDDDPEERLRVVGDFLQDFEPLEVNAQVALQPHFSEPRRFAFPYDAGEERSDGKKGMVTVNWLLAESTEITTILGLQILTHILIGTPASPLRKALIDSGLGDDLAGAGLADDLRQLFFSTGLKGIAAEDADKVESLILKTLTDLSQQGIDQEMVEAALNTIEFRLRENNTGSYPRGLILMITALSTWLYGGDPLAPLAFDAPLHDIKTQIALGERYFENLIATYLLNNTHRTTVTFQPDPELRQREDDAEKARLAETRAAMSQDELQAVIDNTHQLRLLQSLPDSPEALATIPTLKLTDLDRQNKLIPLAVLEDQGSKILYHDLFTNEMVYLDVGFNLHTLPQDYLPYVPLFSRALLELGTQTEDFVKLSQRIGRKTGGLRTSSLTSAIRGRESGTTWLLLRGKATMPQVDDLLAILRDVLLTVNLDNQERFRQIVLEEKSSEEAGLVPSGHMVANTRLRAHFTEADWVAEQMGGVSYLFFLRSLVEMVDTDWPSVLKTLEAIHQRLISRKAMICNVTLDGHNFGQFHPALTNFIATMPDTEAELVQWMPMPSPTNEGLTIPAQINYVAKGTNLYKLGYQINGSAHVVLNYVRTNWLWDRIRVQGGAYGGFCRLDERSGVFSYLSYRDPNLLKTLDNYDGTSQFLRETELTDSEVVKNIIGVIGTMDDYQLPDAKGYTSMVRYLAGDSDEARQRLREEVLATTAHDFKAFAEVLQQVNEQGHVVVLGSQSAIEAANAAKGNWLQVSKVL